MTEIVFQVATVDETKSLIGLNVFRHILLEKRLAWEHVLCNDFWIENAEPVFVEALRSSKRNLRHVTYKTFLGLLQFKPSLVFNMTSKHMTQKGRQEFFDFVHSEQSEYSVIELQGSSNWNRCNYLPRFHIILPVSSLAP